MAKEAKRVRMSAEQAEKFLKGYFKKHDLKGPKEQGEAVRHCAATRWAALERYAHKPKRAARPARKAGKKGHKKGHKKAA